MWCQWKRRLPLAYWDYFYKKCWLAFGGVVPLMQAPRYSLPLDDFFMRPDSRGPVSDPLLTLFHRPHYPKFLPLHTPRHCYRSQILSHSGSPARFWWCFAPKVICEKHYKFSTSLVIWAYRLIFLPDVTLEMDQKTWPQAHNSVGSRYVCCLTKLYHRRRSFWVIHLCHELAFEILEHVKDFSDIKSSSPSICRLGCLPPLI